MHPASPSLFLVVYQLLIRNRGLCCRELPSGEDMNKCEY